MAQSRERVVGIYDQYTTILDRLLIDFLKYIRHMPQPSKIY